MQIIKDLSRHHVGTSPPKNRKFRNVIQLQNKTPRALITHCAKTLKMLSDIALDPYQSSIHDENDRGIFYDSFSQIADNLLELRLPTPEQINDIREQLFN